MIELYTVILLTHVTPIHSKQIKKIKSKMLSRWIISTLWKEEILCCWPSQMRFKLSLKVGRSKPPLGLCGGSEIFQCGAPARQLLGGVGGMGPGWFKRKGPAFWMPTFLKKIYNLLFHRKFPFFLLLTFPRFLALLLVGLGLGVSDSVCADPIGLRSLTIVMNTSVQTTLNISSIRFSQ